MKLWAFILTVIAIWTLHTNGPSPEFWGVTLCANIWAGAAYARGR